MAQQRGPTERAVKIIAAYPGPVTLRPSSRKWLVMLATSVAFAAFGVQMHFEPPQVPGAAGVAWIITGFFTLCAVGFALMLHPAASRLTLDATGFEVSMFFRSRRSQWRTVGPFSVGHVGPAAAAVAYDDTEQHGRTADRNRSVYGHNAALPDTYGFDPQALAQILNAWRERALSKPQ